MLEKLSKTEEDRIIKSIEKAIDLVNKGSHPNEALYKVAQDSKFSPQLIQRAAEAFNVSRTLSHMKHASGASRSDAFPLADAVSIIERMFPEKIEWPSIKEASTSIPEEYLAPERENFMKASATEAALPVRTSISEYARDQEWADGRLIDKKRGLEKLARYATGDYNVSFFKVMELAKEASDYFRLLNHTAFADVETRVVSNHGNVGRTCMDLIHEVGNLSEKRAGEVTQQYHIDMSQEPYKQISKLMTHTQTMLDYCEKAAGLQTALQSFITQHKFQTASQPATKTACLLDSLLANDDEDSMAKSALELDALKEPLAASVSGALGLKSPDSEKIKRDAVGDVFDPVHDADLAGIKTKSMLNDFVSNDPILSTYDPAHVHNAYNQISQFAPTAAQQPALMRGVLQKMLQQEGVLEPFEASQLSDIEKRLRGLTPENPQLPGSTPAKKTN